MRAVTIPIVITLAVIAQPARAFDQDEFCLAVTQIAHRMNARRGKWLDRNTRHDGVVVDCERDYVVHKHTMCKRRRVSRREIAENPRKISAEIDKRDRKYCCGSGATRDATVR